MCGPALETYKTHTEHDVIRSSLVPGRRVAEVVAEGRPHHRQAEVNNAVREHTVGIQPSPNMVQGARPSALDIATHAIEEDSKKMGAMLLKASVAKTNLEWLQRSVIGSTVRPIDFRLLNELSRKAWPHVVKICELGRYKALLIFESTKSAEEALEGCGDGRWQFFHSMCRWNDQERSVRRRVWIECSGVPLHAWSEDTFRAIGSQWGEVVACANVTAPSLSLRAGRMLIDTWRVASISERFYLTVGSTEFEVIAEELGSDEHGSLEGVVVTDVMPGVAGSMEGISGTRNPMKKGWPGPAAEEVALPHRMEGDPEGRSVITADILDEWSNGSLNSNSVTAKNTVAELRGGSAEIEEDASERTQSWDFDADRVVAVGEITSQICLGSNSSKAQLVYSKPKGATLGLTSRDPSTPHAGSVKGMRIGPVAKGLWAGEGDHGGVVRCDAGRRRDADRGFALVSTTLTVEADAHPGSPHMMMGMGCVCKAVDVAGEVAVASLGARGLSGAPVREVGSALAGGMVLMMPRLVEGGGAADLVGGNPGRAGDGTGSFEVSGKGVSRSPLEGDGASLGDELAEGRDSGCQGELDTGVQGRVSAGVQGAPSDAPSLLPQFHHRRTTVAVRGYPQLLCSSCPQPPIRSVLSRLGIHPPSNHGFSVCAAHRRLIASVILSIISLSSCSPSRSTPVEGSVLYSRSKSRSLCIGRCTLEVLSHVFRLGDCRLNTVVLVMPFLASF
ncbi:hypothetical protein HN873_039327 [Arachis hypogaea]